MRGTKSLGIAAAWSALGAKYEKSDRTDPKHIEFFFSPRVASTGAIGSTSTLTIPTQDLDRIESDWVNRTLVVNAVDFYDALQRMKAVIHSK